MTSSRRAVYIRVSKSSGMAELRTVGPVPMTCAVNPESAVGQRLTQQVVEVVIHLRHPVAGEKVLVLPHNWSLKAHHGIYPRGKLSLDPELGVRAILAAAIGHAIVNYQDLAVVAQINAAP